MSNGEVVAKCPVACDYCRVKKVKCNGQHPCPNCVDRRIECRFPSAQERKRGRNKGREKVLDDRLKHLEALLRANSERSQNQNPSSTIIEIPPVAQDEYQNEPSFERFDVATWTPSENQTTSTMDTIVVAADGQGTLSFGTEPSQTDQAFQASPPPAPPAMTLQASDHGEECVYMVVKRRSRKSLLGSCDFMEDRIARMEAALKEANVTLPSDLPEQLMSTNTNSREAQAALSYSTRPPETSQDTIQTNMTFSPRTTESGNSASAQPNNSAYSSHGTFTSDPRIYLPRDEFFQEFEMENDINTALNNSNVQVPRSLLHASPTSKGAQFSVPLSTKAAVNDQLQTPVDTPVDKGLSSIAPPENSHWEYHGPGSFLSICSPPGIDWISEKAGVADFCEVAKDFARDISRPLKLERAIRPDRTPEPDPETAWRYFRGYTANSILTSFKLNCPLAYFEEAPESAIGVVIRPRVESRLRMHFESRRRGIYDDDPEWYALRNIIYASGCRLDVDKASDTMGFAQSQTQGWKYFENALSQHTELLYCRTGLMAVQALALMAFFVEGIGCPSLEYMLCSSAMRLVQSKGMHRQAGTAWAMSTEDIEQRNLIFWMLYTYEKHVVCRSGRPSAIEDDDISCQIPVVIPPGSTLNLEFVTFAIQHAQISSQISKKLSTVRAYHETPEDIVKIACHLHKELEEWRDSLPSYLKPQTTIKHADIPGSLHMYHLLYIHYSYYGSLVAIHSTFTYPWCGIYGRSQALSYRNQVKVSTDIVAEASRNMILATKYISIDAWSPCWLAFYFPVVGLINIFVHVLKYPTLPTTQTDVVLMDIVAGHFARLEFVSSGQLAFSFVRELSRLAHNAVKNARQKTLISGDGSVMGSQMVDSGTEQRPRDQEMTLDHDSMVSDLDNMGVIDFEMENWSALLPSFTQDEMTNMNGLSDTGEMNFLSA